MHFVLETNTFGTGDEHVWAGDECIWAGDEHFSAKDEGIENVCSSVSHTRTTSYQQIPNRVNVEMIAMVTATYPWNGRYHVEEIQTYVDAKQHLRLLWIGLQGQVNRENSSRTSVYSQLHVFSSPGVAWLECHTWNTYTEAPEVDKQACEESLETVLRL